MTIEASWADWLATTKPDANPLKLVLSRKVRPRGSIRELARMRKVFGYDGPKTAYMASFRPID